MTGVDFSPLCLKNNKNKNKNPHQNIQERHSLKILHKTEHVNPTSPPLILPFGTGFFHPRKIFMPIFFYGQRLGNWSLTLKAHKPSLSSKTYLKQPWNKLETHLKHPWNTMLWPYLMFWWPSFIIRGFVTLWEEPEVNQVVVNPTLQSDGWLNFKFSKSDKSGHWLLAVYTIQRENSFVLENVGGNIL